VLEVDRGSLPFALLHGESLVATASWALGEAGVTLLDVGTGWPGLQESGEALALHDALCPATPPGFLATCVRTAQDADVVVAGVRPVTDTVKEATQGAVGATHDRDELLVVTSPVVLPARVVAALDGLPATDLAALVEALRGAGHQVRFLEAPIEGRRVSSREDLAVLEALTAPR
jgi:2-C-methyl-D-erythritol 4-phosphate cytidylyltransferase